MGHVARREGEWVSRLGPRRADSLRSRGSSKSPALAWPESLAEGVRLIGKRYGTPAFEDVAQALNVSRAEFDAAVAEGKDLANPITGYRKILGVTR